MIEPDDAVPGEMPRPSSDAPWSKHLHAQSEAAQTFCWFVVKEFLSSYHNREIHIYIYTLNDRVASTW